MESADANNGFKSTREAAHVIIILLLSLAARLGQHESRRLRLQLLPGREVQQIVCLQLRTGVCTHKQRWRRGPNMYSCLINLIHSRTVIIVIDDADSKVPFHLFLHQSHLISFNCEKDPTSITIYPRRLYRGFINK